MQRANSLSSQALQCENKEKIKRPRTARNDEKTKEKYR